MSTEENKRVVRRFISDVLEGQRTEVLDELVERPLMAGSIRDIQSQVRAVLSDLRYRVDHLVAEGDAVAAFCSVHGRHTGDLATPFMTIPATGRDVVIEEIYRFRIVNGKVDMFVHLTDFAGLMTQVGS